MIVAATSHDLSLRPISTAVPTFGKRKISEVDNTASDETFDVSEYISIQMKWLTKGQSSKRPKPENDASLSAMTSYDGKYIWYNAFKHELDTRTVFSGPSPLPLMGNDGQPLVSTFDGPGPCDDAEFIAASESLPIVRTIVSPSEVLLEEELLRPGLEDPKSLQESRWTDMLPFCGRDLHYGYSSTLDREGFHIVDVISSKAPFASGDRTSTVQGGLLTEVYRKQADATTAVKSTGRWFLIPSLQRDNNVCIAVDIGLYCPEYSSRRAGEPVPELSADWADIYRSIDMPSLPQSAVFKVPETIVQYDEQVYDAEVEGASLSEKSTDAEDYRANLSNEFIFPYTTEVGNTIKALIEAKNPTAARRFIPSEQGIQSVYKAKPTAKAIKDNNLVVEKQRKEGPRTEVHWCRYQARLVDGEWKYSNKPCYRLEGNNTGFASWDIAVRHLKEHHFEMHIPRSNRTKKARILIGSHVYEADQVNIRTKRKSLKRHIERKDS
jgi:hypothetical protein